MEILKASKEWANRPADERYWDIPELIAARKHAAVQSAEKEVDYGALRVAEHEGDVVLLGPKGNPAHFSHWAFSQFSSLAGAPASYLRGLPPRLVVDCLSHGLERRAASASGDEKASILLQQNDKLQVRAVTSQRYTRVWDHEILEGLVQALPQGWRVPPARPAGVAGERVRVATQEDCLRLQKSGLSIKPGDEIAPAGLYASDRDCFVFLVNEDVTIDGGPDTNLGRGFFLWNSEVGASSFGLTTFLYDAVCGNHIVWGAKDVSELRVRHIGQADARAFRSIAVELRRYADDSANETQARIIAARNYQLGATKEEVIEALLGLIARKRLQLTQGSVREAYDVAEGNPRYGSPRSAWGIVQGLTQISQRSEYADERTKIDRAAGKILEICF